MPTHIAFAYEGEEPDLSIDFHRQRAMRKVDASRLEGVIHLERLILKEGAVSPAMLLAKREWKDLYLVHIRAEWNENDYFKFADEAIIKNGILYP